MLNSFLLAIRFLILVFSGHKQVALENIALRHQLAVFTRGKKRPRLRDRDRLFWIALKNLWKDWRSALKFVQPETVIGWQHKRFKRYWRRLSQPRRPGRPRVCLEIRKLVRTMVAANRIWGACASPKSYRHSEQDETIKGPRLMVGIADRQCSVV